LWYHDVYERGGLRMIPLGRVLEAKKSPKPLFDCGAKKIAFVFLFIFRKSTIIELTVYLDLRSH
jgi:hypothetical protein